MEGYQGDRPHSLLERNRDQAESEYLKCVWNMVAAALGKAMMAKVLAINTVPIALTHKLWNKKGILYLISRLPPRMISLNADIWGSLIEIGRRGRPAFIAPFSKCLAELCEEFPKETSGMIKAGTIRDMQDMVHISNFTQGAKLGMLHANQAKWISAACDWIDDIAGPKQAAAFREAFQFSLREGNAKLVSHPDPLVAAILRAKRYGNTRGQFKKGCAPNETSFKPGCAPTKGSFKPGCAPTKGSFKPGCAPTKGSFTTGCAPNETSFKKGCAPTKGSFKPAVSGIYYLVDEHGHETGPGMDVQALKAHSRLALVAVTQKRDLGKLGKALSDAKTFKAKSGNVLAGGRMRFRVWGVELIFRPDSV